MITKLSKPPTVWRVTLILASIYFLVLGVLGVSSAQQISAEWAGVHIPSAWYWFAVVPCIIVASLAFFLPARVLLGRRDILPSILLCCVVLSGSTSPLLYIIYDFERRLADREGSQTTP